MISALGSTLSISHVSPQCLSVEDLRPGDMVASWGSSMKTVAIVPRSYPRKADGSLMTLN